MGIENLLAQGYQPTKIEPYGNALMRAQQFKMQQAQLQNALMQGEDMHAQRALALQQAQQQAAAQQQREAELNRLQGGGQLDPIALLRAGVPKDQIEFLANRGNLGRPEVAREAERAGANGRPEKVFFDKFGNPVGQAMPQAVKMEIMDNGGSKTAYDPYGLLAGSEFKRTMTPAERDASARGWKGLAQSEAHFQAGQNAPKWDGTNMVWVDPKARTVTPAVGPDGKSLPAKAGAATEDERKAAGWLAQADNAWKNMRAVAFDANGNLKPAAKPGFNDALAAVPSFGATAGVANIMRSPERQKFMQAASSLSEALLRAATGAGVNESEARQKIQELTPVIGESEETTKQKFAAIPMYLQALQSRAGRAAQPGYAPPAVPTAAGNKAPALNQDLLNAADAIIGGR